MHTVVKSKLKSFSSLPDTFATASKETWCKSGPTKDWSRLELCQASYSSASSVQPSSTQGNSIFSQVSLPAWYTPPCFIVNVPHCLSDPTRLFVAEPPPPGAARSLVMIAKCLQNLANLVEFGAKESYMEVVNPFILKNKERMVVFLDHVSVRTKATTDR